MKFIKPFKPDFFVFLFIAAVFLIIASPLILSEGMFMDGLFYACISKNLSCGMGSFWHSHFSKTLFPVFYEHPPLALGIQSLLFKYFGTAHFVEKAYSLACIFLTGFLICRIWILLSLKHAWFPLVLWLSIPLVHWSSTNNLLENTVGVFTTLSLFFYLKSRIHKYVPTIYIFLAGFLLAMGFLTKGFVAFFPWTCPIFFYFFSETNKLKQCIKESVLLILATSIPLIALVILNQQALHCLKNYIHFQVLNSIIHIQSVESRGYILQRCFYELIPALAVCLLLYLIGRQNHFKKTFDWIKAMPFLFIGVAGVLPMTISLKQSGFYILPSFPFFAIGLGILVYPLLTDFMSRIKIHKLALKCLIAMSIVLFCSGIYLSISNVNSVSRDVEKLEDIHRIMNYLEDGSTICIPERLWPDWSLHGYLMRYKNISLDTSSNSNARFYLTTLKQPEKEADPNIELILLPTTKYQLYKNCFKN